MGHPKAKWKNIGTSFWRAIVGQYEMVALAHEDECYAEIFLDEEELPGTTPLWHQDVPKPCDLPDLMRLAEAELARRLNGAATTMDGRELVAEPVNYAPSGFEEAARFPIGNLDVSWVDRDQMEADAEAGLRTRLIGANGQIRGYTKQREPAKHTLASIPRAGKQWAAGQWAAEYQTQPSAADLETERFALLNRNMAEAARANPPCSVCGKPSWATCDAGSAMVDVDYPCGHTSDQREAAEIAARMGASISWYAHTKLVVGSRDWAIGLMAKGNTVQDADGNLWDRLEEERAVDCCWVRQSDGAGHRCFDSSELPPFGWDLPPF